MSLTPSRPPSPRSRALPRILCLHGGGTSALIFKIQLRNLTRALSPYFRFIFLDAPYTSPAGPGVLPVFAECAPYYRWMPVEDFSSKGLEKGIQEQEEGAREARRRMVEAIERDTREAGGDGGEGGLGVGEVVGAMGFSQGGRMTAGLLADQAEGNTFPGMPKFHFGVLLCASYPPYSITNASKSPLDWSGARDGHGVLKPPTQAEMIAIPSVHVRGLRDPHLEKGRRLGRYFEGEEGKAQGVKEVREFEMGHFLPQASGDTSSGGQASTNEIRDAVVRIWEGCQGKGG